MTISRRGVVGGMASAPLAIKRKKWTTEDLDLCDETMRLEAKLSFWAYRRYLNPDMLVGWWQRQVSQELHKFWLAYRAGKRPKLLLQSPPQHGKSTMVVDFLSWAIGQDPTLKIIFSSYSDRLGIRANLRLQRIMNNPRYSSVFGPRLSRAGQMNGRVIEFAGYQGYFRNTTVLGSVTGEAMDLGVIDDPIKGRAEAGSEVKRESTWHWLTDDFLTRLADRGALLMIMTRWHLDDPAGRLILNYPGVRSLRYPALAEHAEEFRQEGEPLFPELKSLEFLQKMRSAMTLSSWESLYQQQPIVVGGDMFPVSKITLVPEMPADDNVASVARYWDKAGTSDGGAYTAGVLMARMKDGTYTVSDVRRGQWSALDRERIIRQTAEIDAQRYSTTQVFIEQEPGSGGKESAEATIRNLAGFIVEADRVSGAKEVRADPFAAQWQAGNVRLVAAPWNRDYLDEHEHFPNGKYKDQVDASSGAFNKIASKYRYPNDMDWVS